MTRLLYKLRVLYDLLFFDTVVRGSRRRYVAARLETFVRALVGARPRPRAAEPFVIENRLATFEVDPSTDSFGKASAYFEWQLHSWLPASSTTFVDIGANIGFYSFLALKKGFAKAIAFEPHPQTFRTLAANVRLNGLEPRITLENLALGSHDAYVSFKAESENTGSSRVITGKAANAPELLSVRQTTLDEYVGSAAIDPAEIGYVKIDVEGYEKHVLEGAASTLRRMRPGARLQVELWSSGRRKELALPLIAAAGFVQIDAFEHNYLFEKARD